MVARCLVGGCSWVAEDHLSSVLEVRVEEHRLEKHLWVKPGRLAVFERDALEVIQDGQTASWL